MIPLPHVEFEKAFDDARIQLPLGKTKGSGKLIAHLEGAFARYDEWLDGLSGAKHPELQKLHAARCQIAALSRGIIASVRDYLKGHPARALGAIEDSLAPLDAHLRILGGAVLRPGEDEPLLFRFRKVSDARRYERKELFHIPFEKREKIGVQRFSITGVPCLYLGSTTYVCWEELGRPSPNVVVASALRPAHNIKLLNIAYFPHDFDATYAAVGKTQPFVEATMRLWPLIAACTVPRYHVEANFHEEYIVPQLLLQWVTSHQADWHGIRYSSTRCPRTSVRLRTNVVIPVRTLREEGLCEDLKSMFELTEPVHWETVELAPPNGGHPGPPGELRDFYLHQAVAYRNTRFETFERVLNGLPLARLQ